MARLLLSRRPPRALTRRERSARRALEDRMESDPMRRAVFMLPRFGALACAIFVCFFRCLKWNRVQCNSTLRFFSTYVGSAAIVMSLIGPLRLDDMHELRHHAEHGACVDDARVGLLCCNNFGGQKPKIGLLFERFISRLAGILSYWRPKHSYMYMRSGYWRFQWT